MIELVFTFLVGVLASMLSAIAGAGSGLLTSPYFILLGLPPHVAVATAKLGGVGLTVGSLSKFKRTEHVRWEFVVPFILVSILAGLVGAKLLLTLNSETVRYIVVFGIFVVLPFLLFGRLGMKRKETSKGKQRIGYGLKFCAESIQAAFGSGLGVLTSLVVMFFFGMTAIEANATKRVPGLVKEIVVLPAFIAAGVVAYQQGIALLLGSLLGGYLGAHIAVVRGNKFVRIAMACVAVALAIQVLLK